MPVRTIIVDDNAGFLAAAKSLLEGPELAIVGEAENSSEALRVVGEREPEVVLIDIDLGEESGFAVAEQLHEAADGRCPTLILISAHPEEDFADLVAESPARGFIAKSDLTPNRVVALLPQS